MNSGDIAWMLCASAMVLFMTPGLAIFYGGLVRSKNVLGTIMHSFIIMGVVSIMWVLYGYTMAFGPDLGGGLLGGAKYLGLSGVGADIGPYSDTIPHILFCAFQLMFAVITPALITGAFAERMKFSAFLAFTILWTTLVYFPVCHWVWGDGGWLGAMGALDFAGGTVIHINSGAAALVCALFLGKRKGYGTDQMHPHNLPLTIFGAGVLWFGWFGFNAGSALAADGTASMALFVTQVAAGTGAVLWIIAEWIYQGKPTTLGAASGAVAGLVAITPAAGFVGPVASIIIGGVAGVLCYGAVVVKGKLGYDDALDVVGIHGVGGLWGALATGLFAAEVYGGVNGLFYGNANQFVIQGIGAVAAIAYSLILTAIILKIVDAVFGLRVDDEEEHQGLDVSQHSEVGYRIV
ncbi:ammonium transporter [Desulfatibacillum alkenivorans DSM 16219]|jgi:Amt family ammonium transporter|uniref:Ammonium transporter n=1 Tax=Desulfatibacillum alkenivorans DSM 16219 TaxID=1121393 RepID=A0A1M6BPM0_9BACT|nr:ammonium transporter [Desulfatibacillum alkenivorans]SHI50483.1 ammonium transporter [Desulfatibacillum alkenivorans DSM 16219]